MRLKISWLLFNLAVFVKIDAYTNEIEDEDTSIEDTSNTKSLFYDSKIDAEVDALYQKKKEEKPTISEDAIFLPHETYCQYFYAFDGKDSYLYRCATGYRFDSESLQCVKTKKANCGKRKKNPDSSEEKKISVNIKCTKWSGLVPHKHYCNLYYNCQYKKGTLFMCPPGKMFDTRTNLCLVQDRVKCDKRENPYVNDDLEDVDKPDTESDVAYYCPESAGTFPDKQYCNKFIRCWYGIGQAYVCPKGKLYDEDLRKCRNRNSVYCNKRIDPDAVEDEEEPELIDENPQFSCFYYKGRYVHKDCRYFYQCENFIGRLYACPEGKLFDVRSQSCRNASEVDCNNRDTDSGNQDDEFVCPVREGTFKDEENCGSYYKCKNGKAQLLQCPEGELFDADWKSCNDENDVVCDDRLLPGDEDEDEENVIDENPKYNCEKPHGRFTHKEYCNWFYHCKDGKSSVRACKKGKYYDSHRNRCYDEVDCGPRIPKEDYEITTSKPREFVCPAKNGKFAHPRLCNAYYVCEKYKPKRHDCPKEKLFHDRWGSCVEESQVTCGKRIHPDVYEEDGESTVIDENPKYECKVAHGNFENEEYCDWFYSCRDKKPSLRECRRGKHYDSKSRRCHEKKIVSCGHRRRPEDRGTSTTEKAITTREPEFRCREPRGKFPHNRDCSKFYECDKKYNYKEHKCPKKKLFDAKRKSCEDEDHVICEDRIHPDMDPDEPEDVVVDNNPKYTCKSNYGRFTHDEFCHWYYNCHNKKSSVRECRRGKYYDIKRRKCLAIKDVICDERKEPKGTTQGVTPTTSELPETETSASSTNENDNSSPYETTVSTEVTTAATEISTATTDFTPTTSDVIPTSIEVIPTTKNDVPTTTDIVTSTADIITSTTDIITSTTDIVTTTTEFTVSTPSPTVEDDDNPDKIVDRNPNYNCDGDEGSFAHDSYCHYYYSCKNNKATLRECPEGKYFDMERSSCEDWYLVSCGERLTPEEIGSTFDDFQSTPYIERKSTTSRPIASTRSEPVSKPTFICPTPNGVYPHERNCGKYYECVNNDVKEKMCPEGQLYNVDKRSCYEEQETNCGKRIHPNDDPDNPDKNHDKVIDPNPEFDCDDRHGCFTHDRICKWYYYCFDKKPELRECSGDTYFDSARRKCMDWWLVFCDNRTTNEPDMTSIPTTVPSTLSTIAEGKSTMTTPNDKFTGTTNNSTEISKISTKGDKETDSTERNTKFSTESGKKTKGTDTTESIFTGGSTYDKTASTKVSDGGEDNGSTRLITTPKANNTDTTDSSVGTESIDSRKEKTEVTASDIDTQPTDDRSRTTPETDEKTKIITKSSFGTGSTDDNTDKTGVTGGGKVTGSTEKMKSTPTSDTGTEITSTNENISSSSSTVDRIGKTTVTTSGEETGSTEERTGTTDITGSSKRTSLTTDSISKTTVLTTETTNISGRDKSTSESGTKTTVTSESSFSSDSTDSKTGKTYTTDKEGTASTKVAITTPETKTTKSTGTTESDSNSTSTGVTSDRSEITEVSNREVVSTSYRPKTTPESSKGTKNTDATEKSTLTTGSIVDRTAGTKVTSTDRQTSSSKIMTTETSTQETGRGTKTVLTTETNFDTRSTASVTGRSGVTDGGKETDSTAERLRSTRDSESTTSFSTTEHPILDKCKEEDGDFIHPEDCKKYFTCKDGEYTVNECGEGTLFDEQMRICYREDLVDCGNRRKPETTTDDCDEWLRTSTTSPDGNTSPPTKGTTGPIDEGTGGTEMTEETSKTTQITENPRDKSSTSSDSISKVTKSDFTNSQETSSTESIKSTENKVSTSSSTGSESTRDEFTKSDETSSTESDKTTEMNKLSTSSNTESEYTTDNSTKFEKLISTESDKSTEHNKHSTSSDIVSEATNTYFTKSEETSSTENDKSTENKVSTSSNTVSENTRDFTKSDETSSTNSDKSTVSDNLSTSSNTESEYTKDNVTKFEKLISTENDKSTETITSSSSDVVSEATKTDITKFEVTSSTESTKSTENNKVSTSSDAISENTREDFTKSDRTSSTKIDTSTESNKLSTSSDTVSKNTKDGSTKFEKLISTENDKSTHLRTTVTTEIIEKETTVIDKTESTFNPVTDDSSSSTSSHLTTDNDGTRTENTKSTNTIEDKTRPSRITPETTNDGTEDYTTVTTILKETTTDRPNTNEDSREDTSSTKDISSSKPLSTKDGKDTTISLKTTENYSSSSSSIITDQPSHSTTIDSGENTDLTKSSTQDKDRTETTNPTENFSHKSTFEEREPTPNTSTVSENTGLTKDQTSPSGPSTIDNKTSYTLTSGGGSSGSSPITESTNNPITESTNNPSTKSGNTDLTDQTSNPSDVTSTNESKTGYTVVPTSSIITQTPDEIATTNENINNSKTSSSPDGTPTSEDKTESMRTTVDITDSSNTTFVSRQTRVITETKTESQTTPANDKTSETSFTSSTDDSSTDFTTATNGISETTHKHTTMHPCLTHTHSTPTLPTNPPKIDCNEKDIACIERKTGDINNWFKCPQNQGFFPHPYTKRRFIRCKNGKPHAKKCGKHLVFSAKYMRCVYEY